MAQQLAPEIGTVPTGGMVSVDVEGRRLAVANVDGALFAFDDACTHRHCSLAKGRLSGKTVTCECHGSQFDVTTGKVLRGPAVQPVHTYRVRLQDGRVEIEV
jgi:3-phenylpropionate/trans-cinnamate dioxygenase ferredoxin subunit